MSNTFKQVLGTVVGGVIGFVTTGTLQGGFKGAAIGYALGSSFANTILDNVEGPRVDELTLQTGDYAVDINQVYGSDEIAGNLIWIKDNTIEEVEHRETVKTGAKGGSKKQTIISYTYQATFAIALCDHPIGAISKIYADNVLIYDLVGETAGSLAESEFSIDNIRIYDAGSNNAVDDIIEASEGANTPAFRGVSYVVFENFQLGDFGNRIPNFRFVVYDYESASNSADNTFRSLSGGSSLNIAPGLQPSNGANIAVSAGQYAGAAVFNKIEVLSITQAFTHPTDTARNLTYTNLPKITQYTTGASDVATIASQRRIEFDPTKLPTRVLSSNMSTTTLRLYPISNSNQFVCTYKETSNITRICVADLDGRSYQLYNLNNTDITNLANPIAFQVGNFIYIGSSSFSGYIRISQDTTATAITWDAQVNRRASAHVAMGGNPSNSKAYAIRADGVTIECISDTLGTTWTLNTTATVTSELIVSGRGNIVSYISTGVTLVTVKLSDDDTTVTNLSTFTLTTGIGRLAVMYYSGYVMFLRTYTNAHNVAADPKSMLVASGSDVSASSNSTALSAIQRILGDNPFIDLDDVNLDDIDTSITLGGYSLNQRSSTLSKLHPIMQAYQITGSLADYQLRLRSRTDNNSVVATITAADLRWHELGSEIPDQATITIKNDLDVPARVTVNYRDIDRQYEPSLQYTERLGSINEAEYDLDLPMSLTATTAKQISDILLKDTHLESRGMVSIVTNNKFSHLDADDLIDVETDNNSMSLRVVDIEKGKPGLVKINAVFADVSVYTSNDVADAGAASTSTITPVSESITTVFDTVPLYDAHNDYGFYYGAYPYDGTNARWGGAQIATSRDNTQWINVDQLFNGLTCGSCSNALTSGQLYTVFDQSETLNIFMSYGTLSSATETQVRNNTANVAVYGRPGRWEVIKFITASLQGDGSYTISNLLRGYYGTQHNMGNHMIGDLFIIVTNETVRRHNLQVDEAIYIKATSFNRMFTSNDAVYIDAPDESVNLRAPTHIKATRASGDITLSWFRSLLTQREWVSIDWTTTDVYTFEIDILSGAGGSVLRTLTASGSNGPFTVSYTSAQQVTDFGSAQNSIYVNIYQTDTATGRGIVGQGLAI
jgi:hypothetical protein